MSPDAENRVLAAIENLRKETGGVLSELRSELSEVKLLAHKNSQKIHDRDAICALRNDGFKKIEEDLVKLRIADITQDGNLKLKFSTSALVLQLAVGLITMIPVAVGLYIAARKILVGATP